MRLVYKYKLPSLNDIIRAGRGTWYKQAKIKKELTETLSWIFRVQSKGKSFDKHVIIHVSCYEPNMKRDDDNVLSGACKVILDALQVAKIIKNDSPRYVHLKPERFQSENHQYYTIIDIEED